MDKELYDWITGPLIFGIWLYLAISGIKVFLRGRKAGLSPFMTKSEIMQDPRLAEEAQKWQRTTRKLFLIWIATAIFFFLLSIVVRNTIGFKE